jgi:hypothetical protein
VISYCNRYSRLRYRPKFTRLHFTSFYVIFLLPVLNPHSKPEIRYNMGNCLYWFLTHLEYSISSAFRKQLLFADFNIGQKSFYGWLIDACLTVLNFLDNGSYLVGASIFPLIATTVVTLFQRPKQEKYIQFFRWYYSTLLFICLKMQRIYF